jgi:hypothetical protein
MSKPITMADRFLAAECGTVTFDKHGRIIVVCAANNRITAYLLNPISLEILAKFDLPAQGSTGGFGAGGYFFLDNNDRAIIPTRGRDILRIKEVDSSIGPHSQWTIPAQTTCLQ